MNRDKNSCNFFSRLTNENCSCLITNCENPDTCKFYKTEVEYIKGIAEAKEMLRLKKLKSVIIDGIVTTVPIDKE